MARRRRFFFVIAAAAAVGGCAAGPVQAAAGQLVDVQIVDRARDAVLAQYRHRGSTYVAGRPGERYAVRLANRSGARLLVVLSIDGVNAISGDTATTAQTGYVLAPWQSADITGWRKSDAEAAAFYFTALPDSYAARTERPHNVGVIGVAVFRERVHLPRPQPFEPAPYSGGRNEGAAQRRSPAADRRQRAAQTDRARQPAPARERERGAGIAQRQARHRPRRARTLADRPHRIRARHVAAGRDRAGALRQPSQSRRQRRHRCAAARGARCVPGFRARSAVVTARRARTQCSVGSTAGCAYSRPITLRAKK